MADRQILNRPNYTSAYLNEATIHNGVVYCAGKVGMDEKTRRLVSDDVAEQTRVALALLQSVLHMAGSDFTKLLKVNIFLTNRTDFAAMNAVYIDMIPDPKPARICVTVAELGLNAKVEIDCTAIAVMCVLYKGDPKSEVSTDSFPLNSGGSRVNNITM